MTRASPAHQLTEIERFFGDGLAMLAERHQSFRTDDHCVEPFDLPEPLGPKDHADVGPVDLGSHLGDTILRQTVCIRSRIGNFQHSHSKTPALFGAKRAREIVEHNKCCSSSEFDSAPQTYGLDLFQIGNIATARRASSRFLPLAKAGQLAGH